MRHHIQLLPTKTRFGRREIASDTFVIHDHHDEGQASASVALTPVRDVAEIDAEF